MMEDPMICHRCGAEKSAEEMPLHIRDFHGLTVQGIGFDNIRWPDGEAVDFSLDRKALADG